MESPSRTPLSLGGGVRGVSDILRILGEEDSGYSLDMASDDSAGESSG